MTTEALTMSQDDLFHRLRAAYLRGAKWTNDNVLYTPADVEKAAYDYADAVVSPLTPTVEKVETPALGNPSPQAHVVISDEAVRRAARAIWQTWQEHKKSEASWEDAEKAALQPHDYPKLYEAYALALDEARAALMAAMSAPIPNSHTKPTGIVEVCPLCDIAGCKHLRGQPLPNKRAVPSPSQGE